MRLIMMGSRDGYVARTRNDDMSWTGKTDKQVFRLLTCVGGTIACGSKTWEMMPKRLAGRHMIRGPVERCSDTRNVPGLLRNA